MTSLEGEGLKIRVHKERRVPRSCSAGQISGTKTNTALIWIVQRSIKSLILEIKHA